MYSFLRKLLFLLPAEAAHDIALQSLQFATNTKLMPRSSVFAGKALEVMGLSFPNPIGLAAGLDKNGTYIDALAAIGFGFLEIGTVTPRAQHGNPKPRLFRLQEEQAIINRMGFNNHGLDALLVQLEKTRYLGVLGINIGKNKDTPLDSAADDYLSGLRAVYTHADYVTVNISSPNTPGLRQLQEGRALAALLQTLKTEQKYLAETHERYVPLAVKVAPDLEPVAIAEVADILLENRIDGLVATNTTLDKSAVSGLAHSEEPGGLSGQPLTKRSTEVIADFYQYLQNDIPIIGVGGIMSAQDALAKRAAGAKLIQLYSGFIYGGPPLVKACVKAWSNHP